MNLPKISVVIPTRNRLPRLMKAVDSVLSQSEKSFEVIVVDDGSTDGTRKFLSELALRDERVRPIFNEVSAGGAGARNIGIGTSLGELIAFLDDDDEWLPDKLEKQQCLLQANVDAVACSCSYWRCYPSGKTMLANVPSEITFEDLLRGSVMAGASMCMCRAHTLRSVDGYDRILRSGQDWDLWTRLSRVGKVISCSEPLVLYHVHEEPRISTDMNAQYQGARRFYFKYRGDMSDEIRNFRLSHLYYIMSRQRRKVRYRLKYLSYSWHFGRGMKAMKLALSGCYYIVKEALRSFTHREG